MEVFQKFPILERVDGQLFNGKDEWNFFFLEKSEK